MTNEAKRLTPLWLRVPIGLVLLCSLCISAIAILWANQVGTRMYQVGTRVYQVYVGFTTSYTQIHNKSGSNARFEKVTVNNEVVWEKPATLVPPMRRCGEYWDHSDESSIRLNFHAPAKHIRLELTVMGKLQERETVTCELDNALRPCYFHIYYESGTLTCPGCAEIR
jgi:hypothetical protein